MRITVLTLSIATALCLPSAANAALINEVEPNDTRATAQNIDGNFSSEFVANIFDSTTVPHVSVSATNGSATDVDYYEFTVDSAGQIGFFDIDGAEGPGGQDRNLHTALALFDADGNLLAFDVASEVDPGSIQPDLGSSADSDSFIGSYTFAAPGTYYIGVTNGAFFETAASSYLSATGTLVGPLIRPDGETGGESYAGDSGPVTMTALQEYSDGSYTLHVSLSPAAVPALSLVKSSPTPNYSAVGDTLSYSYLVSNSGNVSLTGPVTVTDDKIEAPNVVTCPAVSTVGNADGELDPGESLTCTATYAVTQADLNAGSVTNVASAAADGTTSPTDTVTVSAVQAPALTLVKTSPTPSYAAVGDTLSYSYLVSNSGNVSLTGPVTVTDDKIEAPNVVTCPAVSTVGNADGELDPGESLTCTATYAVTQADLNAGSVTNVASAAADGTTSPTDTVTVNATQATPPVPPPATPIPIPFAALGLMVLGLLGFGVHRLRRSTG